MLALFPGPPSFRAINSRITFDPQKKVLYVNFIAWKEGEPGNEARSVCTWRVAVGICENGYCMEIGDIDDCPLWIRGWD